MQTRAESGAGGDVHSSEELLGTGFLGRQLFAHFKS